ncbi:MAG: hypothetical protein IPP15_06190 [Saprospiraceae bacterium]|uniref:Cytochrome c domain-containing protein n=1 Tax=Candidatus Opimibacter skivensis TaxID=2982028 RepID=A0A9D7STI3_9BACT|nr:hypothetical protein [Candidatus Opimibacter skivensis]
MRKFANLLLVTLFIAPLCFISCSNGKVKSLNPNGDSELALLMRSMYDDGMLTKQALLEGKAPVVNVKYHQLHTAKATEPEKVATPNYDAFANAYEASVKSFLESDTASRIESYHSMVNACMNCHQKICPGPTVRIKHLFLNETELASLESQKE